MKHSTLQETIEDGILFLSEIFSLKTYLYFPLINSSAVWAAKRVAEWKEKIFSWKVWLEPDSIKVKPDGFILSFFKQSPSLNKAYQDEIKDKDFKALRKAFVSLYPLIGLEDPFLTALFHQELESNDFRKIVKEFIPRVSKARRDIETAEADTEFLEGLKAIAAEILSLSTDLISRTEIRKMVAEAVKKYKERKDEKQ